MKADFKLASFFSLIVAFGLGVAGSTAIAGDTPPSDNKAAPADKPVSYLLNYTGESLSNVSGGIKRGSIYEGLLTASVQGDLEKLYGIDGTTFLVTLLYAHGPSLSTEYTHDFNAISGIDAYDSIRLYETWIQKDFGGGKLSIRVGNLLSDAEFCTTDHGALFVNAALGAIPLISHNWNSPVYPMAVPGARVRYGITEALAFQLGVFEGNVGQQNINNKHGLSVWLNDHNGAFVPMEFDYRINGQPDNKGLHGVWKLGGFYHSASFADSHGGNNHSGSYGFYGVVDQEVWRKQGTEDEGLSVFSRTGFSPSDRDKVPFYGEAGLSFKGLIPGRHDDVTGLLFYYTRISDNPYIQSDLPEDSHHESVIEFTHKVAVCKNFSFQPEFQYVSTPYASRSINHATIVGVRFNVTFP